MTKRSRIENNEEKNIPNIDNISDMECVNVINKVIDELEKTSYGHDIKNTEVKKKYWKLIQIFSSQQNEPLSKKCLKSPSKVSEPDQSCEIRKTEHSSTEELMSTSDSDEHEHSNDKDIEEHTHNIKITEERVDDFDPSDYDIFFRDLPYLSNINKLDEIISNNTNKKLKRFSAVKTLCDDQIIALLLTIPCKLEKKIKNKSKSEHLFVKEIYKAMKILITETNDQSSENATDPLQIDDIIVLIHGSLMDLPGKSVRNSIKLHQFERSTVPVFFICKDEKLEIFFSTSTIPESFIRTQRAGNVGFVHNIIDGAGLIEFLEEQKD